MDLHLLLTLEIYKELTDKFMNPENIHTIRKLLNTFYHLEFLLSQSQIETIMNKFSYNVAELLYSELNFNGVATTEEIWDAVFRDINRHNQSYYPYTNKIIAELSSLNEYIRNL